MKLLLAKHKWFTEHDIHVTGFIRVRDRYIQDTELAEYFSAVINPADFEEKLLKANGQFAVIILKNNEVWAATDRLRSIPLFYSLANDEAIIGDSAYSVASEMNEAVIDEDAAQAFLATGYTLNNLTLIKSLYQVEAGEMVILDKSVRRSFYHDYSKGLVTKHDFNTFSLELNRIIEEVFKSHFAALKDKFIAIPLSGGYDSRLIASMCKKYHPDNVMCFTYGRENNMEVEPAREIAKRLQLPWVNIIYDEELINGFLEDAVFQRYYPYASELGSMFYMQDYFAVKYLKEHCLIPRKTVFMPGHSGNFLAGEHVAPFMRRKTSEKRMLRFTLNANFTLKNSSPKEKRIYEKSLLEKLSYRNTEQWLKYENWDIKERQSKFIVNSAAIFTFFGYEYVMPLWDSMLIDFFNELPIRYKINKNLYDYVLTGDFFRESGLNLASELNPTARQIAIQRIKIVIKRLLPQKIVTVFINPYSPVLYDEISKRLIMTEGKESFKIPHESNNYNSYLTQWYLIKTRALYLKNQKQNIYN
jgi:asparagine synthase (glutamine-hydrolysing)